LSGSQSSRTFLMGHPGYSCLWRFWRKLSNDQGIKIPTADSSMLNLDTISNVISHNEVIKGTASNGRYILPSHKYEFFSAGPIRWAR